ncbi:hypothetical protein ACFXPT_11670 [Streptomyces goshikiensis]|uniref:hypothetical protein n=1 Tax=Streptomyces goshikiensis TaxID=1942 RepID=UPI0036C91CFD
MDSPLPSRTPVPEGRQHATPDPRPGAPSRTLRIRAAGGWERFMRRSEMQPEDET